MNKKNQTKGNLREEISSLKKKFTQDELDLRSQEVISVLELTGVFQSAKTIFIYNNLSDEVKTSDFVSKWSGEKDFYMPVVVNDNLVFRKWAATTDFQQSSYGIQEPVGMDYTDYKKVDLIIVPGMAFDRNMNRLGRGKGYYDRFLAPLSIPKLGICFDFQLLDNIPADANDIKMNYLVSENELIW